MRKHFFVLLLLCLSAPLFGQAHGTGAYPFATLDSRGFDTVNVGNLNVRFTIPIVSRSGRGTPFSYALQYEGLIWSSFGGAWHPDPAWGFTGVLNGTSFAGYLTHVTTSTACPSNPGSTQVTLGDYIYYDPFGASHTFNYSSVYNCNSTTTVSGDGSAYDNSGYTLVGSQVRTKSGSLISPGTSATGQDPTGLTDSNGNEITSQGNGVFTDTLGTAALTIAGTSPRTFTYPVTRQASGAKTAQASLSYTNHTVRTAFQCANIGDYGPYTIALPDHVTLADNSVYGFTYEPTPNATDGAVTGRLASVTLPTGGMISYAYSGGCSSASAGIDADGAGGTLTRTTSDGQRTYTRGGINANATFTTVKDEKGNQTDYAFSIDATTHLFVETHRQVHQGNVNGPTLMEQYTCYNGSSGNCVGSSVTLPVSEQDTTVSYNGGSQVLTKSSYDTTSALLTGSSVSSGGTTLASVANTYNTLGELTTTLKSDGNGTAYAYTALRYDEGSVTGTSGVPQHVSATGTRGNLTSTHVSAGSAYIDTAMTYYDTGVPVNSTAADGGVTTYGYDSTQGFVTSTALPTPSSGVGLVTYAQYDTTSAALTMMTGVNGESTVVGTYDALLRPVDVTLPSGSRVTANIVSPVHSFVSQTLDSSRTAQTETLLDGYGRVSRVNTYNGQSANPYYQVDYCYDASGMLQFQSSPYQSTGINVAKHCSGSGTAYTYDALGRTTGVTTDDGTNTTTYSSRAVQTTDVNNISKITQYDLLGRVSGICEISSTSYGQVPPGACSMDIAGTGFVTSYSYNLAQNLTTITQGGETRTIATDNAGRTISTTERERGTTTYSYAYSNGLQVTRTRPHANQLVPSTATTKTTTQYDLLGRVTGVTYDDGSPGRFFFYDTDDPNGGWSNAATNAKGRLAGMRTDAGPRAQFMYDVSGNVISMQQCTAGTCNTGNQQSRPLSFGYDLANTLKYESDAATGGINFGLSAAEEITSVTNQTYSGTYNPANLVSNVVNSATGPTSFSLGNGLSVYAAHDNSGRLYARWLCSGSAQLNCPTQVYGTDVTLHGSHVTGSDDTVLGGYAAYGYDDLNRLASVNRTNGNQTVFAYSYTYDRYGNRGAQTQTGGNSRATTTLNYSFANQITSPGYTYDIAGNLQTDPSYNYQYDAEGNLVSVNNGSIAQYTYDALNRRVSVQNPNGSTDYTFDAFGQRISSWLMPQNSGVEGRIYMNGSLLAYRSIDGSTVYSSQDILGTERMRTNYAGAVLDTFKSLPFGDGYTYPNSGASAYQDNLHFSELEHDTETQTEHATFRQYRSFDGRWMSPDPYDGSYDIFNPQSFNRYTYALNNPSFLLDPSGLCGKTTSNVLDPITGAVISTSTSYEYTGCWELGEYGGGNELANLLLGSGILQVRVQVSYGQVSNNHTATLATPTPPPPAPTKVQCVVNAIRPQTTNLRLDALGVIPVAGNAATGIQAGASTYSFVASVLTKTAAGGYAAAGSILGLQATGVGIAAEKLSIKGATAIAGLSNLTSAVSLANDYIQIYNDAKKCLANDGR